jgi:hypothetical protein
VKQTVSPALAGTIVVVVLVIAAFFGFRMMSGTAAAGPGEKPPGMPADAQAEFQKRLGSATPTSAGASKTGVGLTGTGPSLPGAPGTGPTLPGGPGGGAMTAPMPGR